MGQEARGFPDPTHGKEMAEVVISISRGTPGVVIGSSLKGFFNVVK